MGSQEGALIVVEICFRAVMYTDGRLVILKFMQ